MTDIKIRGARTHNLKNINLDIPRDQLTVITGLSGCGKSSLAFDTIYAEGQRRYVESLSAYVFVESCFGSQTRRLARNMQHRWNAAFARRRTKRRKTRVLNHL
jgi:excinuclease UvrABC ATPase subunit